MFSLADIDIDVHCLAALPHDHARIDFFAGSDEHLAAFLGPEQAICNSCTGLECDQGTGLAVGNLTLERRIAVENGIHDAISLGIRHEISAVADEAAGRDHEGQAGVISLQGSHIDQFALALSQLLDDIARKLFGDIDDALLDGLKPLSFFIIMIDDLCLADRKLISFAAHRLNKNGQVQLAAAGDLEGLGRISILDPQRNIRIKFSVEPVADMAAGDIFSVFAGQRRIVDVESHGDRGLGDLLERDGHRIIHRAQRIADMKIIDTGDSDDRSDAGLLHFDAAKALELIELTDLDLAVNIGIVVVDDHTFLIHTDLAVVHFADADTAYIFIVVDGADQHLCARFGVSFRRGNIINDGLKKRLHAGTRAAQVHCRNSGLGGCKDKRTVNLLIAGTQIHKELQHLIDHLRRTSTGAVDLIDTDNDGKIESHGFAQDKTGLGHGSLKGIHDQNDTVDHLEHSLNLTAEIRMSGCVDDIDLRSFIIYSGVFAQDRDPALALQVIGIHDPLLHSLILTENTALFQKPVHQRGLAVVDMGDNRYISDIFSLLLHNCLS